MNKRRTAVLIILDGWGVSENKKHNAIYLARPPVFSRLLMRYPHTLLEAHGKAVGLPDGQVGNSEAGHLNIGAGRVVKQDSVYISDAIADGTFFNNPAFVSAMHHVKEYKSRLHLLGILSGNQCPHMFPDHVAALLKMSQERGVKEVVIHFFTDGRDSPPDSAIKNWSEFIQPVMTKNARAGSVTGRLYLDRKKKWERTEKLYDMLTTGVADFYADSLEGAVNAAYKRKETDEFISLTMIKRGGRVNAIQDGDAVIFYNLRSDRARQLTRVFVQPNFAEFKRKKTVQNLVFVAMTDFGPDLGDILTAYPSRVVKNSLPMAMAAYRQLYVAEMEKYAHITFFINGGYPDPVAGEKRILVRSKDVTSYASAPEMSAREITSVVLSNLKYDIYDFIVINYANADMIGHTGNLRAAVKGIRTVDVCMGEIIDFVVKKSGLVIVTADHGNVEYMKDEITGRTDTMHETNMVPFIFVDPEKQRLKRKIGKLADVAPTLLDALRIDIPKEMTGESLILK